MAEAAGEVQDEGREAGWSEDLRTLAWAVAIALLIRTFMFQTFYVPSDSMLPTLLVGDHVFVNKLTYGPRVPFTGFRIPGLREPERGEILVFRLARGGVDAIYAADHRRDLPTETFIKRVVGLPGDVVEVRGGRLILNGEVAPLTPTGETFRDGRGDLLDVYVERLEGCTHRVLDDPNRALPDMPPRTVEPGRYFFLGDNRDNSHDSRRWGTARLAEIEGPAGLLYWSWDWNGRWVELLNPLTWWRNLTQRTRWGRMGSFVGCDD